MSKWVPHELQSDQSDALVQGSFRFILSERDCTEDTADTIRVLKVWICPGRQQSLHSLQIIKKH